MPDFARTKLCRMLSSCRDPDCRFAHTCDERHKFNPYRHSKPLEVEQLAPLPPQQERRRRQRQATEHLPRPSRRQQPPPPPPQRVRSSPCTASSPGGSPMGPLGDCEGAREALPGHDSQGPDHEGLEAAPPSPAPEYLELLLDREVHGMEKLAPPSSPREPLLVELDSCEPRSPGAAPNEPLLVAVGSELARRAKAAAAPGPADAAAATQDWAPAEPATRPEPGLGEGPAPWALESWPGADAGLAPLLKPGSTLTAFAAAGPAAARQSKLFGG